MPPSSTPPNSQSSQRVMRSPSLAIAGIGASRPARVATPTGVS